MTAQIIAFPTARRQADVEFERTGETDLTRALDEAVALWGDAGARSESTVDPANYWSRHAAFSASVAELGRERPEVLSMPAVLDGGRFLIGLGVMPEFLAALWRMGDADSARQA